MRVLDAGCGPGTHLGLIASAIAPGGMVTGIDLDPENVAMANGFHADLIASKELQILQGDILDLDIAARSFDLAWSSAVFHHLTNPLDAVVSLNRMVTPGGTMAIMDGDDAFSFPFLAWPPELEANIREAMARAATEAYGGRLDYFYDGLLGRRLPALLRESGLHEVQLQVFADVDRAPLPALRMEEIRNWFLDSLGLRIQPYLAPADWERLVAMLDLETTETSLLSSPDFFMVRSWLLVTVRVPA